MISTLVPAGKQRQLITLGQTKVATNRAGVVWLALGCGYKAKFIFRRWRRRGWRRKDPGAHLTHRKMHDKSKNGNVTYSETLEVNTKETISIR